MDADAIIKKISERTGKPVSEIEELVNKKIEKFSGLLTRLGAAYAVAKDFGVDVEIEREAVRRVKVKDLKKGMEKVDLLVRVFRVFPPRTFSKGERFGRYCKLVVGDETGKTRLTLWHKDVDLVESGKIKRGTVLEVINAYVSEYNGELDVSTGYDGRIIVDPKIPEAEKLPEAGSVKVEELKEGMEDVNIILKVLRVFEKRIFDDVPMLSFVGGDETGTVRVVLWGENAEIDIKEGDTVEIEGGYVRPGETGISLHVGRGFIRKADEVLEIGKRKKIEELAPGDRYVEVRAVITREFARTSVKICPQCGKRVEEKCECGSEPEELRILSVELFDGSGTIRGVFFGNIVDSLPENTVGLELVFSGYVRENKEFERKEFVVKAVYPVDWKKELERILEEKGK